MAEKKKRRRQNIPKDEDKSQRFVRVVSPRVDKAVKAIKQIALCAGKTYEYTPQQANQIKGTLMKELTILSSAFEKKAQADTGFKFSS